MKLSRKLMLLPLCAFLLIGCSDKESSSSLSESEIITSEPISSQVSGPTWSDDEINLMKTYLNGEVLPYAKVEGATWSYNRDLEGLIYLKNNATIDDINTFRDGMLKDKAYLFYDDPYGVSEGVKDMLFIKPLQHYEDLNECIYVSPTFTASSQKFDVQVYYDIDIKEWQEDKVNEEIKRVHGIEGVNIPKPSFSFNWILVQGIKDVEEEDLRFVTIRMSVDSLDYAKDYQNTLIANNYRKDDFLDYVDPTNQVCLTVYPYESEDGCEIIIDIYNVADLEL